MSDVPNEILVPQNIGKETLPRKSSFSESSPLATYPHDDKISKLQRNKDYCFFCENYVLNFGRHIVRNHDTELEVQKIMATPVKSKKRKDLIGILRKKGNYLMNNEKCVRPVKKPALSTTKFLPCTHCLGFYSSKQLWRHRKKCLLNPDSKAKNRQSDAQNFLIRGLQIDEKLRDTVFPHMRADNISLVAKKDSLICAFGARYLKTHRDKHFINVISRKMRELSKILITVKVLDPSTKNLFHALQPKNYDLFIKATKIVANYDEQKEIYKSPTFAMNIATSLKQCCEIGILYALKKNEIYLECSLDHNESDLKTMIQLFESHWKFDISSQAADDLNMQKWNKITIIPLAADLKLLKDFLITRGNSANLKLQMNNLDEVAFNALLETVYCRVLLLNRKRPGELQRLLLHYYKHDEITEQEKYEEFDEAVSLTEKVLLKKFKRIVIRGKRGRGVPVLFSYDVQDHIKTLLKCRSNFVDSFNPYLFARAKTLTPIYGYKVLQKYANLCGAKNPKAITSTRLRKHLATLTQMFNMTEGDIEQLATFMGHTMGIHKKSYRLPDDVYQTAKIAKLLILMENGTAANFKGKSLDDIEINLEDNLYEEKVRSDDEGEINKMTDEIVIEEYEKKLENLDSQNIPDNIPEVATEKIERKKKKRILVPWTNEQKETVIKYFHKHVKDKKPPKRHECEDLIQKHPNLLENKSWEKIKVFIQNIYKN